MRRSSETGFTLIELIVSLTIAGILAGMVALFVRWPVQNYVDAGYRADLTAAADTALRRLGRDIRQALPNSLRIATATCTSGGGSCYFVEFIPIKAGGRYRTAPGTAGGSALDLEAGGNQSFDVLGPPLCPSTSKECSIAAGDSLVLYNRGSGNGNAYLDPTANPRGNRRLLRSTGNDLASVGFTGSGQGLCKALPTPYYDAATDTCSPDDSSISPHYYELSGFRFYLVGGAVTYECPVAAGTAASVVRRHSGYALAAAQPTSFSGARTAILTDRVASCSARLSTDNRLFIFGLTLQANGESIRLLHQIDLYNAP